MIYPVNVTGTGYWFHHFWGEYFATVVLLFEPGVDVVAVAATLGHPWQPAKTRVGEPCVRWHGKDIDAVKAQLVKLGAPEDIDNCNKSIDHGALDWPVTVAVLEPGPTALEV